MQKYTTDTNLAPKPPCMGGYLLSSPNAQCNGTKTTDSLGRTWCCPSTNVTVDPNTGMRQDQPGVSTGQPSQSFFLPAATGQTDPLGLTTLSQPGGGGRALPEPAEGPPPSGYVAREVGPTGGTIRPRREDENIDEVTPPPESMGWWDWPPEMRDFYDLLLGRANEVLGMEPGFDPTAIAYMFGRDFENVRAKEAANRDAIMRTLGRQGQLGTGTELGAMMENAWNTSGEVSDVMRDVFLANELQKRQDLQQYTDIAQGIFGTGMSYNEMIEAINAARRGEQSDIWNQIMMMLNLFGGA